MDKDLSKILSTEYSEQFDAIRKKMMVMSYYKYGPVSKNYEEYRCLDAIGNLRERLQAYLDTGNTEYLADAANFAMIEFMHPSVHNAHYTPTDAPECDVKGFGINEVKREVENR